MAVSSKSSLEQFSEELRIAIQASPIIYISHCDETLIDEALKKALKYCNITESVVSEYYCGIGEVKFDTKRKDRDSKYRKDQAPLESFIEYLESITDREFVASNPKEKKSVFLIRDIQAFMENEMISGEGVQLNSDSASILTLLQLHAERYLKEERNDVYTVILLDKTGTQKVPTPLTRIATCLSISSPSSSEIRALIKEYDDKNTPEGCAPFGEEESERLCRALQGLELQEIRRILRTISRDNGGILTSDCIHLALEEKRKLVKRDGILEVIEAEEKFSDIGGLHSLKDDLNEKRIIFNNIDRAIGDKIRIPKGIMIVGVPGCGKSMIAKAISSEFMVPLLRLDMNRILGQYVGQSEQNMKKALNSAQAASPCVLWIDEIEKAFSGASGNADESKNDTVLRMMGLFLTWMQEHKEPVYVVATANDVMRPELMRKGRFDEIYFVDFPDTEERKHILKNKIDRIENLSPERVCFDVSDLTNHLDDLADYTEDFSGAELQSLVEVLVEKTYVKALDESSDDLDFSTEKTIKLLYSSDGSNSGYDEKHPCAKTIADDMKKGLTSKQMGLEAETVSPSMRKFLQYSMTLKAAGNKNGFSVRKCKELDSTIKK